MRLDYAKTNARLHRSKPNPRPLYKREKKASFLLKEDLLRELGELQAQNRRLKLQVEFLKSKLQNQAAEE